MTMPNPATLLPHREPMLMVSNITGMDGDRLTAQAVVQEGNPLLQDGRLPGHAALEMLAQASGLFLGLAQAGQEVRPGAIVSVRDMQVHIDWLQPGARLTVETECLGSSGAAAMFRGSVKEGDATVLDAMLTVSSFPEGVTR